MWSNLVSMNKNECEHAAQIFKDGCLILGLRHEDINELCEVIKALPPREVFAGIAHKPSFEGFRCVLENVKSYMDDTVYVACLNLIPQEAVQSEAVGSSLIIQSNSYAFLLLTLVDVMAGCSKIGAGSEDAIAMVSGARELAALLFEDRFFKKMPSLLNKLYKGHPLYYPLIVPVMFAHAVLLEKSKKSEKRTDLPNTLREFSQIQEQHFGGCLTEASIQSRSAYVDLLGSDAYQDNAWLEGEVSSEMQDALFEVSTEVKRMIRDRIALAEDDHSELREHVNVAFRWLNTPPYTVEDARVPLCSVAMSPLCSECNTPYSAISSASSASSASGSLRSMSAESFNFFPIGQRVRSVSSLDSLLDVHSPLPDSLCGGSISITPKI